MGDEIFSKVERKVSYDQNQELLRPFESFEVKEAVFSMHPDKSPGPDGLNPGFYQAYWDIVGSNVSAACLHYLNNCVLPSDLNATSIILIPKVKLPERITDLRPIALCNVIYKIMAKVLANRLKKVLPGVISESQSAFI